MPNVKPTSKKFSPLDLDDFKILVGATVPPGVFEVGALFFNSATCLMYVYCDSGWTPVLGPSGVVDTFLALTDTPNGYTGDGLAFVNVKADELGIEFVNAAAATARLSVMTGASPSSAGVSGTVPAPSLGHQGRFLRGDASWQPVVTSEVEVTRGFGPPIGAPASTNDLYVDLTARDIYYSTGTLWEKFSIPGSSDGYAVMPSNYPASQSAPTVAEAKSYALANSIQGPTVIVYAGGGTNVTPAFAWFLDSQGEAVLIRDLTSQRGETGATGPSGPAGAVWRGSWSSSTSYLINDMVQYSGSSWIAIQASVNVTPTAGAYWNLVAQKGADGAGGSLSDGDRGDITITGGNMSLDAGVVSNSKLAAMPTQRIKGRVTIGTGDPEDLTGAQATSILNLFTSSLKGLVPASGGGTSNYLRADGTWAQPAGGGEGGGGSGYPESYIIVTGTGDAETDNGRFASAVAQANAFYTQTNRIATILIDHDCIINSVHTFTSPTGLECTPGSWLIRNSGGSIVYGQEVNIATGSGYTIGALSAGDSSFTITQATPPVLGKSEYVVLVADNNLIGVTPHDVGINQRPAEVHRIARAVNGSSNTYVFGDYVDDPFTASPRLIQVNMLSGIRIRNFNYKMQAGVSALGNAIYFSGCADVEMYNCNLGYPSPGSVVFKCCYNVRRHGINFADQEDFYSDSMVNTVPAYGLVDRLTTSCDIANCTFGSVRHGWTTGAVDYGGHRYGSVKNFKIHGNRFGTNGVQLLTGPSAGQWRNNNFCDSHSEGRRGTISDNEFNVPGDSIDTNNTAANAGVSVRHRDAIIRGNTFNCAKNATPVRCHASGAIVSGNTFNGGLRCEVLDYGTNSGVNDTTWSGNVFRNFSGPPIYIGTGSGHRIVSNTFMDCGSLPTSNYKSACVEIGGVTGGGKIHIANNYMPKYSNSFAIYTGPANASQVVIEKNVTSGYATSLGLDSGLAATATLESTYGESSSPSSNAEAIGVNVSDETTNLTVGTAKVTMRLPFAMTLTSVYATVTEAPAGTSLIVDVNKNAVSIFSTRLSIDDTEKTSNSAASPAVISTSLLQADAEITIDIDQVGSTLPGKGLKVWLVGNRS